jgi:hypothetical protein
MDAVQNCDSYVNKPSSYNPTVHTVPVFICNQLTKQHLTDMPGDSGGFIKSKLQKQTSQCTGMGLIQAVRNVTI